MSSARAVMSRTSWVTSRTVSPSSAARRATRRRISRRAVTSRADIGSSRTSRRGLVARARASATRAACPPESSEPRRAARCSTPAASSSAWARSRAAPLVTWRQRGPKATLSRTLMWVKIPGAWDSRATSRRPAGTKPLGPSSSRSPRSTRPPSASSRPATTPQTVDLPEPLGPMRASVRPAPTSRSAVTFRWAEAKETWRSRPRGAVGTGREAVVERGDDIWARRDGCDGCGRRRTSSGQEMLVAPTMRKDMAMSTTASAREVAVSFSRSR